MEIVFILLGAVLLWLLKQYADHAALKTKRRRQQRVRLGRRAAARTALRAQREEEQRRSVAHLPVAASQRWNEAQVRAGEAVGALEEAGKASVEDRTTTFYEKLFEMTDAIRAAGGAIVDARRDLRRYEEGRLARLTYSLPPSKLGDREFAPLVEGMIALRNCAHRLFLAADGDPLFAQARVELEATRLAARHAREALAPDGGAAGARQEGAPQSAALADALDAAGERLADLAADMARRMSEPGAMPEAAEAQPARARSGGAVSKETQELAGRIERTVLNVGGHIMPSLLGRT